MYADRDMQLGTGVPSGPIEYQQNLLPLAGSHHASKGVQRELEEVHRDGWQEQPEGSTARGMNETIQIRPLVARLDNHAGTLAFRAPDPAQNGL